MKRKTYFDILRIVSSMAVVMVHTSALYWHKVPVNSLNWQAMNYYDSISRWGVPVFFMISGALFLSKEIDINTIIKKHVKRIVILFYLWSMIYAIKEYISTRSILSALNCFLFGKYHMWYLVTISALYLATPLIRKMIKEKKDCVYFLILSFIFSFVIPSINEVLNALGLEHANNFVSNLLLTNIPCYIGYYVLGYYLDNNDLTRNKLVNLLGVIGLIITIACSSLLSLYLNKANSTFYDSQMPNVLIVAVAVFIGIKHKTRNSNNKIIIKWSKYTLCIYLVHPFVLSMFRNLNVTPIMFNSIIAVPLVWAATYITSFFIAMIMNKIPIIRKYMV